MYKVVQLKPNQPNKILSIPTNLAIINGCIFATGFLFWTIFGHLPTTVKATGTLIPFSSVSGVVSPSDGVISYFLTTKDPVWFADVLGFIDNPESFDYFQTVNLINQITQFDFRDKKSILNDSVTIGEIREFPFTKITAWISSPVRSSNIRNKLTVTNEQLAILKSKKASSEAKLGIERNQFINEKKLLTSMKSLQSKKYISITVVLSQSSKVDDLRKSIAETQISINELMKQANDLKSSLTKSFIDLLSQEVIVTDANSIIYQILPRSDNNVEKGKTVFIFSTKPVLTPTYVPIFLEESLAASVLPGMKAIVTPAPNKQIRVCVKQATVSSIDKIPSNKDDLEARLGLYTISSKAVSGITSPVLAILRLQKDPNDNRPNSGGYKWSSKSELPYPIQPTSPLNVQILTLDKSPISYILPSFGRKVTN